MGDYSKRDKKKAEISTAITGRIATTAGSLKGTKLTSKPSLKNNF